MIPGKKGSDWEGGAKPHRTAVEKFARSSGPGCLTLSAYSQFSLTYHSSIRAVTKFTTVGGRHCQSLPLSSDYRPPSLACC